MHKSSEQSTFQQELKSVPINSMRPSTRCTEGPDSASTRERTSYKRQTMGSNSRLTIEETGSENKTSACALQAGMCEPSLSGPWPWSVLLRYPAQGLCLLRLPEKCEFLGTCSLKSPLQASHKLLSWLTGHVLGCYP